MSQVNLKLMIAFFVFQCGWYSLSKADPTGKTSLTKDKLFLSHDDFVKLSSEKQIQYLSEIQKIWGAMPLASNYIAQQDAPIDHQKSVPAQTPKSSRSPASAEAALPLGTFSKNKAEKMVPIYLENLVILQSQTQDLLGLIPSTQSNPDREKIWAQIRQKNKESAQAFQTFTDELNLVEDLTHKKNLLETAIPRIETMQKKIKAAASRLMPATDSGGSALKDLQATEQAMNTSLKLVKLELQAQLTGSSSDSESNSSKSFFRCLYAGFIVKQNPCKGLRQIPQDIKLIGPKQKIETCENPQVLCNPLIFGVTLSGACSTDPLRNVTDPKCLQTAKPICVNPGAWPTFECAKQTNDTSRAYAAALIKNNPEAYENLQKGFGEFCNTDKIDDNLFVQQKNNRPRENVEDIKRNIRMTCVMAKTQLLLTTQKFGPPMDSRPRPSVVPAGHPENTKQ